MLTKAGPKLSGAWQQYSFKGTGATIPVDTGGSVYVALGWSAPHRGIMVTSTAGFDCVTVQVMPAP
jgi:hypothetical protein